MELNRDEQRALLRLARTTIERNCAGEPDLEPADLPEGLYRKGAVFVTLYKGGNLRGCVGTFDFSSDLVSVTREMAISASQHDTRFTPVTAAEVDQLDLSISMLTPPVPLRSLEEVVVGKHGILISKQWYRGVLLPKVAVEWGWDRETFLAQTCRKAGMQESAYKQFGKDEHLKIEVFTSQDFAEKDFE